MHRSANPPTLASWMAGALGLAAVSGCGGTSGALPDDMSTQAHREAAASHAAQADEHEGRYDPNASRVRSVGAARGDFDFGPDVYNPTEVHRQTAERHREQAADHVAAAQALDQFEEAECGSFPANTRRLCPLLGQVTSTETIDDGIRVHFAEGVRIDAAFAHVRCHLAYARSQGHQGMDRCPLYLRGIEASHSGPDAVDLTTDDDAIRPRLRQRTISHVVR